MKKIRLPGVNSEKSDGISSAEQTLRLLYSSHTQKFLLRLDGGGEGRLC